MRSSLASLLAAVAVGGGLALFAAAPASAHDDTIEFALSTDSSGRIVAKATWADDHHPVEERVAATLVARSTTGIEVGPVVLTPVDGKRGELVLDTKLEPGTWTLLAESADPALGRGESTLTVKPAVSTVTGAGAAAGTERFADPEPEWASAVAEVATLSLLTAGLGLAALWVWRRRTS